MNQKKSNPDYYKEMLAHFSLKAEEVIYFEHDAKAVESAKSVGIKTHCYDSAKKDLAGLKEFLDENL